MDLKIQEIKNHTVSAELNKGYIGIPAVKREQKLKKDKDKEQVDLTNIEYKNQTKEESEKNDNQKGNKIDIYV